MSLLVKSYFSFALNFVCVIACMPLLIKIMNRRLISQPIHTVLSNVGSHAQKKATPTMGGLVIFIFYVISTLLFCNLNNKVILLTLFVSCAFFAIGLFDDITKVAKKNHAGLSSAVRFILECCFATIALLLLDYITVRSNLDSSDVVTFGKFVIYLNSYTKWIYFALRVIAIVGCANGLNITDGLDGLVAFPTIVAFTFFGILSCFIISNITYFALYVESYVASDFVIVASGIVGGLIAFLFFNAKPAKIFMGDVGSLFLGGTLGFIASALKAELVLIIVCAVFVIETVSVILQVASFKLRNGKRIFLMAPLHHHFEKLGWSETQIVQRSWLLAIICALIAGLFV